MRCRAGCGALLGGVVLVAIAAVFWIDQTSVLPPVLPSPTPVAPAPALPAPPAPAPVVKEPAPAPASAPTAQETAPSLPLSPAPPAAQEAAAPPPLRRRRPLPTPAPDAGQQAASPPCRPPRRSRLRPSSPRSLRSAPAPLAETPLPPPAPGREAQEVAGIYAPKSLAQLVGTWAYSAADCERLFQRRGGGWAYRQPVDKFAQAAIVESPKRILLPSAICRIDARLKRKARSR